MNGAVEKYGRPDGDIILRQFNKEKDALMLAWHNDPGLKTSTIAALHEDLQHDRYIRGNYASIEGGEWRGCHIGCLVMSAHRGQGSIDSLVTDEPLWHELAETAFGVPIPLAYLWDRVYENVPIADAPAFAVASVEAVPVGGDLSMVVSRVMHDLLTHCDRGVWKHTEPGTLQREAVDNVAALYTRRLAGDEPTTREWQTAASEASEAAYAAAASAAYEAAYEAASAAASEAAYAYAYAYYAAEAAYAYAREAHFSWIAARIIHHTQNAPTKE